MYHQSVNVPQAMYQSYEIKPTNFPVNCTYVYRVSPKMMHWTVMKCSAVLHKILSSIAVHCVKCRQCALKHSFSKLSVSGICQGLGHSRKSLDTIIHSLDLMQRTWLGSSYKLASLETMLVSKLFPPSVHWVTSHKTRAKSVLIGLKKTIAKVRNCPDITIWNSLFSLLVF